MEAFSVDTDEGAEDTSEPRNSRMTALRSRLFARSKRAGGDSSAKFSQSASDIHAGKASGSDEDLPCPQGMMGSRALSHDSIFWADRVRTDDADGEPVRVLSQENVHSKIKALQMALRRQKMHLGPPPLGRQEDEDALPPHESPEVSTADLATLGGLGKVLSQPRSRPLSPIVKAPDWKCAPCPPLTPSVPAVTSPREAPLGFGAPAEFTPSLDTSAARHRVSVKPRNRRPGAKRRRAQPDTKADHINNHPEPVTDEHDREDVMPEDERGGSNASRLSLPKHAQPEAFPSEAAPDHALPGRLSPVSSQELQRRAVVTSSEGPRPYFEAKRTTDSSGDPGIQVKSLDESDIVSSRASAVSKYSHVRPQDEAEVDGVRGLKRPGSGSFHFSMTSVKSRIEDRPRSGSFVGQTGSRHKAVEDIRSSLRQREERQDPQPGERASVVGRLTQGSGPPWERRDSVKQAESAKIGDDVPSGQAESSREVTWEAVVATKAQVRDEERKTMFGFKLRSTSNSVRFWSDGSSGRQSSEGLKRHKSRDHDSLSKNASTGNFTLTDPAPPRKPAPTCDAPALPTEVQITSSNQSSPRTASSEVSWVSLAMEKTRSLHQLFARRFPKDLTSSPPQSPAQTPNFGETLNGKSQTARLQECEKAVHDSSKEETEHSKSSQKTTGDTWEEPEAQQSHIRTSQPAVQINVWATQSPSRAAPLSESPSHFGAETTVITQSVAQSYQTSGQHPTPWGHPGLQPATHRPESTTPPVDDERRTVQEKESPSPLGKRSVRPGSVSEKAAFLERQAERCTTKGVESRKAQLESKPSSDRRDPKPGGREGFRLAESPSPARVADRPREENWMRKNPGSSQSPSSSPVLRSTPDSSQPSWMELAKRKSMAWSDKTMD
ncbi:capping protein-inhibiting regulator of actin dynamics isoform X2 [Phyllopteryx taeniolatus]|uniref:capping protein-inhibiting regulator of actin dynamics isoform X2 n=1 Tax=Phyllopteryx taeniolatus TaxID=161469 RepID=UPI002AD559E1|nr:capping protein-inhibiting regulator of actin dynamics isoform X2 [Phyllopteryx taeniolatus]